MRLRVTVDGGASGPQTNVTVVAEPEAPSGEVLAAIARVAGTPDHCGTANVPPAVDGPLAGTGLHDGAVLGVGAPGRGLRDSVGHGIELRVVGGPSAGLVCRLGVGRAVVGRHASCAVTIPDPEISREHAALEVSGDGTMTIWDLGSANGTALEGIGVGAAPVPLDFEQVIQVGASFVSVHPVDPLDADLSDDGQFGYVFNRRYRIRRPTPAVEIEFPVLAPEEKAAFPWAMMLAPLILVPILYFASHGNPLSFLMVLASPVMVVEAP